MALQRSGSLGSSPSHSRATLAAATGGSELAEVGDVLGNAPMFMDSSPVATAAAAGQSFAAPGRDVRSSDATSELGRSENAGLSADFEGLMTLLAGVGVMGFLAFKRGGARSRD